VAVRYRVAVMRKILKKRRRVPGLGGVRVQLPPIPEKKEKKEKKKK
jgi:hypothetical protein